MNARQIYHCRAAPRNYSHCLEPSRVFDPKSRNEKNVLLFLLWTFDWLSRLTSTCFRNFHGYEKLRSENNLKSWWCWKQWTRRKHKIQQWRTIAVSTITKATNNWMTLQILTGIIPECSTMSLLHAIDRNTHISLLPPSRMQRYESKNQSSNCFNNSCRVRKLRWSCTCMRY